MAADAPLPDLHSLIAGLGLSSVGRGWTRSGEVGTNLPDVGQGEFWGHRTRYRKAAGSCTQDKLKEFLAAHKDDINQYRTLWAAGSRCAEAWPSCWCLWRSSFERRPSFSDVALSLVQSRPQKEFLQAVITDLNQMLAHFIRAQLTLAAFSLVVYVAFLGAVGAPYPLALGTAGGVMEFIPVVGPLVAAFLILIVAVLMNYQHWWILWIFLAVWRLIQDYVISPRVMGSSMELHPLAAIFGVMAGGEIAGVLGVYLSIPVMASLRIVWRRGRIYVEKRRFGPLNEYVFGSEILPKR